MASTYTLHRSLGSRQLKLTSHLLCRIMEYINLNLTLGAALKLSTNCRTDRSWLIIGTIVTGRLRTGSEQLTVASMSLVTCCLMCCQYPGPATVWDTQWLVPRYCADPSCWSPMGHSAQRKQRLDPLCPQQTHRQQTCHLFITHSHTTLATHPHSSVFISWMRMRMRMRMWYPCN